MNWDLIESNEYKLLMKVANNSKLMWLFKNMLADHLGKHMDNENMDPRVKREDCEFCLLILNW